jgi:hypothetical protein
MFVFVVLFILSVVYYFPWTEEKNAEERYIFQFLLQNNTTTVNTMSTHKQTHKQTHTNNGW